MRFNEPLRTRLALVMLYYNITFTSIFGLVEMPQDGTHMDLQISRCERHW